VHAVEQSADIHFAPVAQKIRNVLKHGAMLGLRPNRLDRKSHPEIPYYVVSIT
jgi:hypothetical protein